MQLRLALWTGAIFAFVQAILTSPSVAGAPAAVAYQMDAAHDGNVTFKKGFSPPLTRLWMRDLGHATSYPLIVNGMIFVTKAANHVTGTVLVALDEKTGETVWEAEVPGEYYWSAAAYDKGRIFVLTFNGVLNAFTADRTGTLLWSVQMPNQFDFTSPPTAYKGTVFVGGAGVGGTLYAVDESTGAIEWTNSVENGEESSPAVGDNGVYVTYPCQYYKFDPASGRQIWDTSGSCEGGGGSTPVYFQDRVLARDLVGGLDILDANTGRITATASAVYAPAAYTDAQGVSYLFALVKGGQLQGCSLDTGDVLWTFSAKNLVTAPIVVNGMVIEGAKNGDLYFLDPKSGAELWSTNIGAHISAPNENTVYQPLTGLGAGENILVIPAGGTIVAYAATDGASDAAALSRP
jgi:outer membrane protein assembly factor BamB